jgi:NAD(P)-dependent dehydrogenase (short-subunit alcohol dehydrogenase family)
MNLKNKNILLTGSTSGIGKATLECLLNFGAHVYALGRSIDKLTELKELYTSFLDVLYFDALEVSEYRNLVAKLPLIDGVVHCSGVVENNPLKYFSLEKYERMIVTNQTSPLLLTSELVRASKINSGGSIVLVSSINGPIVGVKGTTAYASSKSALTGMAKVMALELAQKQIRVNCVLPGMVDTEMLTNLSSFSEEQRNRDFEKYPLGKRYAKPVEIAHVISFLVSDYSTFITGQNLIVDGGCSIQ